MDFSVVIPLYNKRPHVRAAVESALAQTLQPREIIVVDDGSTDGSLEAVRDMGHASIKLFERSPPGPGGYAARNLGIEKASGDWIAFLDADDLWRPDHLSSLSGAIDQAGETVGCAFSGVEVVSGERRYRYAQSTKHLAEGKALHLEEILLAWLDTGRCPIWTGCAAFRRELLLEAGLFPAGRAKRGGDKDLWLRCVARASSAYAKEATAEFHQETVNRVSHSAGFSQLPIIFETISMLLPQANPKERKLLRQLANQEVLQYCRYAAGGRSRGSLRSLSALYLPEGLSKLPQVAAFLAAGFFLGLSKT